MSKSIDLTQLIADGTLDELRLAHSDVAEDLRFIEAELDRLKKNRTGALNTQAALMNRMAELRQSEPSPITD